MVMVRTLMVMLCTLVMVRTNDGDGEDWLC